MRDRTVSRADAKVIAETAADLADKVLTWKQRALAAEDALSKFAGEIYRGDANHLATEYAALHAAASAYFFATTNRKATEAAPALRAALARAQVKAS